MAFSGKISLQQLIFQGSPSLFWGRLVASSCWGRWLLLRLQSAVNSGKTLFREKTFVIRKNPWPFGKTYSGKNSLEKPIAYLRKTYLEKPTMLFGKKLFRKTHLGKTYCLQSEDWSPSWTLVVGSSLGILGSLQNHEYSVTCQTHGCLLISDQQVDSLYESAEFFGLARPLPCLSGGPCVEFFCKFRRLSYGQRCRIL